MGAGGEGGDGADEWGGVGDAVQRLGALRGRAERAGGQVHESGLERRPQQRSVNVHGYVILSMCRCRHCAVHVPGYALYCPCVMVYAVHVLRCM